MKTPKAIIGLAGMVFGMLMLISSGVPFQAYGSNEPAVLPLKNVPPQLTSKFRMPLAFEEVENQTGQTYFRGRGPGYEVFLTPKEAFLIYPEASPKKPDRRQVSAKPERIPNRVITMQWLGAEASPRLVAQESMQGYRNYHVGNKPEEWRTKVPLYQKAFYRDVYPGIDLVFYERDARLEYDFVVAPGADPKKIRLAFQGVERLSLEREGSLVLHTPEKKLAQRAPVIYQEISGVKKQIPGQYVLTGENQVAFSVGDYDPSLNLVIDPHIEFCTYLGGSFSSPYFSADDQAQAVALDRAGNVYVTGYEFSLDGAPGTDGRFPKDYSLLGPWAYMPYPSTFVTKFNPEGELIWSQIISGKAGDFGYGIAVDGSGNAYVTGHTSSENFPILNGYQDSFPGTSDPPLSVFVVKLDSDGHLLYSTFLGGSEHDHGSAIAADDAGNAYVTGYTQSENFPTKSALMTDLEPARPGEPAELTDVFVAKLDTTRSGEDSLVFSTYLGGTQDDYGTGIAVDSSGNIYVAGISHSADFPLVNAFPHHEDEEGCFTVFLSKFNPSGSELLYSTHLGPNYHDYRVSVAVDDSGGAYLTGATISPSFPVRNALLSTPDCVDAFVSRIDTNRSGEESLIYSTFLGGSSFDFGDGIAVRNETQVFAAGTTSSADFPVRGSLPAREGGFSDIFVTCLNTMASGDDSLTFSTYLGGTSEDTVFGVAADDSSINVVGRTMSPDLPATSEAYQREHADTDSYDAFVLRISEEPETRLLAPPDSSIFYYPPRNFSVVGRMASAIMPLGWGNTTRGMLSMQVALPKFESPMNLYLALFDGKNIDPKNLPDLFQLEGLSFIGPKGEIQDPGPNPAPWKEHATGPIDQLLAVNVSHVDIAGGQCYLALITLPVQVTDFKQGGNRGHYTWITNFPVIKNQQKEVLQSLKTLNLKKKGRRSGQITLAIQHLKASLAPRFWQDVWTPGNSGRRIFDENRKAVHALLKSRSKQTIVAEAIDTLVKASKTLATNAIVEAVAKGGNPRHLVQARENMEKAQIEIKAENLVQAIIFYSKAWDVAEKAEKMANTHK